MTDYYRLGYENGVVARFSDCNLWTSEVRSHVRFLRHEGNRTSRAYWLGYLRAVR